MPYKLLGLNNALAWTRKTQGAVHANARGYGRRAFAFGEQERAMALRAPHLPTALERSLLQKIRSGTDIKLDEPASKATIARLLRKGWAEELRDADRVTYLVTPAGLAALSAKIPLHR